MLHRLTSKLTSHLSPPAFSVGFALDRASKPPALNCPPVCPDLTPVRERAIQGLGLIISNHPYPNSGLHKGGSSSISLNLGLALRRGGYWAAISSEQRARPDQTIHSSIDPVQSSPVQSAFCIGTTPAACFARLLASAAFPPPPAVCCSAAAACCCSTCPPALHSLPSSGLWPFFSLAWGAECHRRQGAYIPVLFVSFLPQGPLSPHRKAAADED